jgi:hypothetical protein
MSSRKKVKMLRHSHWGDAWSCCLLWLSSACSVYVWGDAWCCCLLWLSSASFVSVQRLTWPKHIGVTNKTVHLNILAITYCTPVGFCTELSDINTRCSKRKIKRQLIENYTRLYLQNEISVFTVFVRYVSFICCVTQVNALTNVASRRRNAVASFYSLWRSIYASCGWVVNATLRPL